MKKNNNLIIVLCLVLMSTLFIFPVLAETITPLCQAGTPFDASAYPQDWPQSDPMVFQCSWDGTGQVYISGDSSSITGVYADDGFTINVQPRNSDFTTGYPGYGGLHPEVDLTSGMIPGVNTFTIVVHNWRGLSMSYGSYGIGEFQAPYLVQMTGDNPVCDAPIGPYVDFDIENHNWGSSCPSGGWQSANCYSNALMRYALAGKSTPLYSQLSQGTWMRNGCPDPGHSFAVQQPYNMQTYIAGIFNRDTGWSHAVTAELLAGTNPKTTKWEDWKFYNYWNLNIPKGDKQIPAGGDMCRTKVWIRDINTVFGCADYDGPIVKTFYIGPDLKIYPKNNNGCEYSGTSAIVLTQDVRDAYESALESMDRMTRNSVNKWEYDETTKEITFHIYREYDKIMKNGIHGKQLGKYTIRIIHDTEFESMRADVQKQVSQLRKNPNYQIAQIVMGTDAFGEPPGNYVELWVNKLTPENQKLDNTMIQGYTIVVIPMSPMPKDTTMTNGITIPNITNNTLPK